MSSPRGPMVGLDFETFGTRDIKKIGLDNYVADPHFKPLRAATYYKGQPASGPTGRKFDFVCGSTDELDNFGDYLFWLVGLGSTIGAHNAAFEKRVLRWIAERTNRPALADLYIVDTAVIARCYGVHGKLELTAKQMLNDKKHEAGARLIKKFCLGEEPVKEEVINDPDWNLFGVYCLQDATLSSIILTEYFNRHPSSVELREHKYDLLTRRMNERGWPVDVEMVKEIQNRYNINLDEETQRFRQQYDRPRLVMNKKGDLVEAEPLNLNSHKQLKEWCGERGIQAKSFSSDAVDKLHAQITKKLYADLVSGYIMLSDTQRDNYGQVLALLELKQKLGGSSLSKLPVILNTVSEDGRLRNQYMHCGAGQTYRTSGVGVQMQNLKRLSQTPLDMEDLYNESFEADNETLAENLRQVFRSSHPDGQLIVGDFSSVESRGLAYLAGEEWKLQAYRDGKDMYKVLASTMFHLSYEAITKPQRGSGKTGELGCGYGAGAGAIVDFSAKIGNPTTLEEATKLVVDWRSINPKIVELWALLERLLYEALTSVNSHGALIGNGLRVSFYQLGTPVSLQEQHPGARSIQMELAHGGDVILRRKFHGCYLRGHSICFYKPSSNINGKPWSAWYTDPKTKRPKYYSLYGGKLAGILTQSFCRELFFRALVQVESSCVINQIDLIGQFHDEIVLDWVPTKALCTLEEAEALLRSYMSYDPRFPTFPLEAEIKHDYRYTK